MTKTRTTASLDILKRVDSRGRGHSPWQGRNYAIHRLVLPVATGKKIEDPGIVEPLRIEGISSLIIPPFRDRLSTQHRRYVPNENGRASCTAKAYQNVKTQV